MKKVFLSVMLVVVLLSVMVTPACAAEKSGTISTGVNWELPVAAAGAAVVTILAVTKRKEIKKFGKFLLLSPLAIFGAAFADGGTGGLILGHDGVVGNITLAEGCRKGDLLGYSSGWYKALATTPNQIYAMAVALMDGVTGDVIQVCFGKTKLGGRLSGMTPGNPLYCAEGTDDGQYTDTAPSTTGDVTTIVGYSVSATEAIIDPRARATSLSG
jgi:hypothetical protein